MCEPANLSLSITTGAGTDHKVGGHERRDLATDCSIGDTSSSGSGPSIVGQPHLSIQQLTDRDRVPVPSDVQRPPSLASDKRRSFIGHQVSGSLELPHPPRVVLLDVDNDVVRACFGELLEGFCGCVSDDGSVFAIR